MYVYKTSHTLVPPNTFVCVKIEVQDNGLILINVIENALFCVSLDEMSTSANLIYYLLMHVLVSKRL